MHCDLVDWMWIPVVSGVGASIQWMVGVFVVLANILGRK